VLPGGRKGFCATFGPTGGKWEKTKVKLGQLQPGPILHKTLPECLLDIIRWTYKVVGRYIQPTLEQWELGFMRDMHVKHEVHFWHRAALAFITYHRRRNLPLRSDAEEIRLIGVLCKKCTTVTPAHEGTPGSIEPIPGEDPEETFIRECLANPDGIQEEIARTMAVLGAGRWTPPPDLEDWPAAN
jgi:hypothetical protein